MDDFLFVFKNCDEDYSNITPAQMQERMGSYSVWMDKLMAAGRYKGGAALHPDSGRLVKDKSTVLTDGPFLESKEIIGGYAIITAQDYDEAVAFAKDCPLLDHWGLEIRKLVKR